MRALALLTLLASGCGEPSPPYNRSAECGFHPVAIHARSIDVLIVHDARSLPAEQRSLVEARVAQAVADIERDRSGPYATWLHVGVISSDLALGGALQPTTNGDHLNFEPGPGRQSFPANQSLKDAVATLLAAVPATPSTRAPLEVAVRALDGTLDRPDGFLRQDATVVVLFVSDGDDASPRPLEEYQRRFSLPAHSGGLRDNPRDFHLVTATGPCESGLLVAGAASRLNTVTAAAKFHHEVALCAEDYNLGLYFIEASYAAPCPELPIDAGDDPCVVEDEIWTGSELVSVRIPRCTAGVGAPCYQLVESPHCAGKTVEVDRGEVYYSPEVTRVACACGD